MSALLSFTGVMPIFNQVDILRAQHTNDHSATHTGRHKCIYRCCSSVGNKRLLVILFNGKLMQQGYHRTISIQWNVISNKLHSNKSSFSIEN